MLPSQIAQPYYSSNHYRTRNRNMMLSHKSPYLAQQMTKKKFKNRLQWSNIWPISLKTIDVVILKQNGLVDEMSITNAPSSKHDLVHGNLKPMPPKKGISTNAHQTLHASNTRHFQQLTPAPPGMKASQLQISSYLAQQISASPPQFPPQPGTQFGLHLCSRHPHYLHDSIKPSPHLKKKLPHTDDMINECPPQQQN